MKYFLYPHRYIADDIFIMLWEIIYFNLHIYKHVFSDYLKDECPVDVLRACVFIYLPCILKNNVEFRRK